MPRGQCPGQHADRAERRGPGSGAVAAGGLDGEAYPISAESHGLGCVEPPFVLHGAGQRAVTFAVDAFHGG
eukprot:1886307-Rhodomonas_salina.1